MKTLYLGAIVLILPNLLNACNKLSKCQKDCIAAFGDHRRNEFGRLMIGSQIHYLSIIAQQNPYVRACMLKNCGSTWRYVYFNYLSKPETFMFLKSLTAPILEDVYLLKVFSAKLMIN